MAKSALSRTTVGCLREIWIRMTNTFEPPTRSVPSKWPPITTERSIIWECRYSTILRSPCLYRQSKSTKPLDGQFNGIPRMVTGLVIPQGIPWDTENSPTSPQKVHSIGHPSLKQARKLKISRWSRSEHSWITHQTRPHHAGQYKTTAPPPFAPIFDVEWVTPARSTSIAPPSYPHTRVPTWMFISQTRRIQPTTSHFSKLPDSIAWSSTRDHRPEPITST